eukprot:scaffold111846_cov29-Tisochrysis_lutea.AAC.3
MCLARAICPPTATPLIRVRMSPGRSCLAARDWSPTEPTRMRGGEGGEGERERERPSGASPAEGRGSVISRSRNGTPDVQKAEEGE